MVEEEGADFCRGEGKLSAGAVGRSCYFGCCWKKKKTRGQRGVAGLCFFEEETMERKKKKEGRLRCWFVFLQLLLFGG